MEKNKLVKHFIHLFKYNDWATKQAAQSIIKYGFREEKLSQLLSHIINAQKIWLNRLLGREVIISPWDIQTIEENENQSIEITAKWINYLEGLTEKELEKRVDYKNTKKEKYSSSIKDITMHVINHSTYHRAQIAQIVGAKGGTPAITDYIFYQRNLQ